MRITDLFEASIPFGRQMPTTGMTFGFEAELIADKTCFHNEAHLADFSDDDELIEELGCDETETMDQFELWKEDRENADDLTLADWIADIGEKEFWETSRATGNWGYALKDDEIVQLLSWHYASEQFAEDFDEEFGADVWVAPDSETPFDTKKYNEGHWYLERDPSVGTADDSDHSFELISPIYEDYEVFKRDIEWFFRWLQEHYTGEIFTNRTTGFHVNIGFKGREIDPLKLLLFAGERWIAHAWHRENNEHTNSLLAELNTEGLPRSPEASRRILDAFLADTREKHWVINLRTLAERGYVEFRPIGNADYEKRWSEVEQHMDRFIQLMHIASDPQMFRREYQKKLGKLIGGQSSGPVLNAPAKAIKAWMDTARLGDGDRRMFMDENGKIVMDAEKLFKIIGVIEGYPDKRMPDVVLKTLLRASGLDKKYQELCREYDQNIPYGADKETYAAARKRLDPILG